MAAGGAGGARASRLLVLFHPELPLMQPPRSDARNGIQDTCVASNPAAGVHTATATARPARRTGVAPGAAVVSPQAPVPPLAAPLPPRSRPRRSAGKDSGRRTSNYRGVSFHKPSGKWRVRIKVGSQEVRLGYFATELDAAKRYDQAASQYHGADAWLNFGEAGAAAVPAGTLAAPATHKAAACQPASAAARASAGRQRKQKPQQLQVDVTVAQQQEQPSDGLACGLGPRQPSSGSVATTTPPATPGSPTSVLGATASGAATATVSMMPPPAACTGETASSRGLVPKAAAMPLLPDDRSREAFFAASLLLGMR